MKFLLLAAAAAIAVPAVAQETPGTAPTDQSMPAGDPSASMPQSDPSMQGAPQGDPSMQTAPAGDPSMQTAPTQTTGAMPMQAPMDPNAPPPAGGYQPSGPATTGPVAPGAQVVFKPAPSPSEAFPPPPPKAKYPICKKGQYDGCMQRGGK